MIISNVKNEQNIENIGFVWYNNFYKKQNFVKALTFQPVQKNISQSILRNKKIMPINIQHG